MRSTSSLVRCCDWRLVTSCDRFVFWTSLLSCFSPEFLCFSKVVSTHLWNTPLYLYQKAKRGISFINGLVDCLECARPGVCWNNLEFVFTLFIWKKRTYQPGAWGCQALWIFFIPRKQWPAGDIPVEENSESVGSEILLVKHKIVGNMYIYIYLYVYIFFNLHIHIRL